MALKQYKSADGSFVADQIPSAEDIRSHRRLTVAAWVVGVLILAGIAVLVAGALA